MARIGIMGGTFDPIHNGHLQLGRQAREEYHLEQVWFMPSGQPPHKKDHAVTDAWTRLEMVRLAIAGQKGFSLSDFEIRRPGNTYTAQTLKLLSEAYPENLFYFIIGADSLYDIEKWYRPDLVVTDVVYAPPETKMLREARAAGCRTCDGLGMLLCQGAEAFRLYSGLEMPVEEIRALLYT